MKRKLKPKPWFKSFILAVLFISVLAVLTPKRETTKVKETTKRNEKIVLEIAQAEYEEPVIEETSYITRMTSYYADDGYGTGKTTASGLSPANFEINENGWYTYNGKLVIATASERLGYTEMRTYSLYDEITLNIDGTDYDAVVLDVCGACMKHNRIDLFVSGSWAVKDTMIEVKY